jgi:large subunit ribosomal protein L7/L12
MATTEEIIEAIGNMSVLELVELKKAFEETFDVTAAAAAAVMMAAGEKLNASIAYKKEEK